MQLSNIVPGTTVQVASFREAHIALKLMEFGINIGSFITVERIAPFGGPMLIQTQNGKIALRKEEAQTLTVSQD